MTPEHAGDGVERMVCERFDTKDEVADFWPWIVSAPTKAYLDRQAAIAANLDM